MPVILGISAFYHDSAAALLLDGEIVAAAQEERFTREKHTSAFPVQAVRYCLEYAGTIPDAIVFYEKPFLKFERLLESYYRIAPAGFQSFMKAMPSWLGDKLQIRKRIREGLRQAGVPNPEKIQVLFSEHHLSHAASAYYPSPFSEAAVLTIDGVGEWPTASIGIGRGNELHILKEIHFPHSIGLLYSACTYYLGFTVNSGEYKVMGLAPYANPESERVQHFRTLIETHLIHRFSDGSFWVDMQWFSFIGGLRMVPDKRWGTLFGFPRRNPEAPLEQQHADLAMAFQLVTEELVISLAAEAARLTGIRNLCMAGGVALNCVANARLQGTKLFDQIWIQPAAGDAGGALGAALAAHSLHFSLPRKTHHAQDRMVHTLLGPGFEDAEIVRMLKRRNACSQYFHKPAERNAETARLLANGLVVGWFQDRMEFGPRALGARSILADPRVPDMQQRLNLKIKFREGFRPFAPVVLEDYASEYFGVPSPSPYMLFTAPVLQEHRGPLPADWFDMPFESRIRVPVSSLPAVTHLDGSSRVQTVSRDHPGAIRGLLEAFYAQTGCPVLVNTSFNVRGEPIVCTPDDAFRCFMETNMDALVIGNHVLLKTEQPDRGHVKWKRNFRAD